MFRNSFCPPSNAPTYTEHCVCMRPSSINAEKNSLFPHSAGPPTAYAYHVQTKNLRHTRPQQTQEVLKTYSLAQQNYTNLPPTRTSPPLFFIACSTRTRKASYPAYNHDILRGANKKTMSFHCLPSKYSKSFRPLGHVQPLH